MADTQTITLYPSGYVADDYSYASVSNIENGYTASDSTTYSQVNLKTGSQAETYFYYTFDTSAIPEGSVISGITCSVKATISTTSSSYISSRTVQLYSGTTAKGTAGTLSTSTSAMSLTTGDWTYDEIANLRLRLYAKRGTSSASTSRYIRFYGATLTITYVEPKLIPVVGKTTIGGVAKELSNGHVNIDGTWKNIVKSYANVNGIWLPTFKFSTPTFKWYKYADVATISTYDAIDYIDTGDYIQAYPGSSDAQFTQGYTGDGDRLSGFHLTLNSDNTEIIDMSFADDTAVEDYQASRVHTFQSYSAGSKGYAKFDVDSNWTFKDSSFNAITPSLNLIYQIDNKLTSYLRLIPPTPLYDHSAGAYIGIVESTNPNAYKSGYLNDDGYWYWSIT